VAATPLVHDGKPLSITLSGGVAALPEDGADWDRLFAVADARLYEAKRSGRNRVVSSGPARGSRAPDDEGIAALGG
jgi:diguanylate cyclase (GGDEF)-like protein